MLTLLAQADVREQAGTAVNATSHYLATLNWVHPTWILYTMLGLGLAVCLYGLSLGRDRLIGILVSVYIALAVVNATPFVGTTDTQTDVGTVFFVRLSIFIVVQVLLFFLLSRSVILSTLTSRATKGSWWQVIIVGCLYVGLTTSVVLSLLPLSIIESLPPGVRALFTAELARFGWVIAPVIAMAVIKGTHPKKTKNADSP